MNCIQHHLLDKYKHLASDPLKQLLICAAGVAGRGVFHWHTLGSLFKLQSLPASLEGVQSFRFSLFWGRRCSGGQCFAIEGRWTAWKPMIMGRICNVRKNDTPFFRFHFLMNKVQLSLHEKQKQKTCTWSLLELHRSWSFLIVEGDYWICICTGGSILSYFLSVTWARSDFHSLYLLSPAQHQILLAMFGSHFL